MLAKKHGNLIANRYTILRQLGEGSMGKVFLVADSHQLKKERALKIIKPTIFSKNNIMTFRKEFEVMSRLKHPNLARVYDFGHDDDLMMYYLTMDYVTGLSLRDLLLESVCLETEFAVRIFVQLCRTLSFIHSRNIIHGDIKPANIIIQQEDKDGDVHVKVLDFGVADVTNANHDVSRGTLLYMAPEVLQGRYRKQSDIFSAGVLFYEMVTGKSFYSNISNPNIITILRNKETYGQFLQQSLSEIQNAGIRDFLSPILQFDPRDRYADFRTVLCTIQNLSKTLVPLEKPENYEAYLLGSGLVGRNTELRRVQEKLSHDQIQQVLLVHSRSGIGKSRFFEEFEHYCNNNGVLYLNGHPGLHQGSLFDVFLDVFPGLFSFLSDAQKEELGPFLRKLHPGHSLFSNFGESAAIDRHSSISFYIDRVCSLFKNAQKRIGQSREIVVVLHDIHEADPSSWELIDELMYRMNQSTDLQLHLYMTARTEHLKAIQHFLRQLDQKGRLELLELSTFTRQDVTQFIETVFGADSIGPELRKYIPFLASFSEGNAAFLKQILGLLLDKGKVVLTPQGWELSDVDYLPTLRKSDILERNPFDELELSDEEYHFLHQFALLDHALPFEQLITILADDEAKKDVVINFFEKLEHFEIVLPMSLGDTFYYTFKRKKYRHEAVHNLSSEKRRTIHFTLCNNLQKLAPEKIGPLAEIIAQQALQARELDKAFRFFRDAGDFAWEQRAHQKALRLYQQAIELGPGDQPGTIIDLLIKQGHVLEILGKLAEAETVFLRALTLAEETEDSERIAETHVKYGEISRIRSLYNRSKKHFLKAFEYYKETSNEPKIMLVLGYLGVFYHNVGDYDTAMDYLMQQLELALKLKNTKGLLNAYGAIGLLHFDQGNSEEALQFFAKKKELAEKNGETREVLMAMGNTGIIHIQRNNYDQAMTCFQICARIARGLGDKRNTANIVGNIGALFYEQGDYEKAMEYYQRHLTISTELNDKRGINQAIGNIGILLKNQGHYSRAQECFVQKLKLAEELGDKKRISIAHSNLGDLILLMGDDKEAEEHYLIATKLGEELGLTYYLSSYYTQLAYLYFEQKKYEQCEAMLARSQDMVAKSKRQDVFLDVRLLELKLMAIVHGELEQAVTFLQDLLKKYARLQDKARISHVIFQLTKSVDYARGALVLYTTILNKTPSFKIKQKREELQQFLKQYRQGKAKDALTSESAAKYVNLSEKFIEKLRSKTYVRDMLELTAGELINHTPAHSCQILLFHNGDGVQTWVSKNRLPSILEERGDTVEALLMLIKDDARITFLDLEHPFLSSILSGIPSDIVLIIVPIQSFSSTEIQGAIFLEGPNTIVDHQAKLKLELNVLAQELTSSIEVGRLREQNDRINSDWHKLFEISQVMRSVLEPDDLLKVIIDAIIEITRTERGYIMLAEDGELQFKVGRNDLRQTLTSDDFRISLSIPRKVMKTGQPVLMTDVDSMSNVGASDSVIALNIKALLCVPLQAGARLIGVLYLDNSIARTTITNYELHLVTTLAATIAITIENAFLYENIKTAHEQLQKVDELKSKFITLASHEFRTPLTVLSSYLEFLDKPEKYKQKPTQVIPIMRNHVARLTSLVTNLADLAKLSKPEFPIKRVKTSMQGMIALIATEVEPFIQKRRLNLQITMPSEPILLLLDTDFIWQALINIIFNAIKYTPDEGTITIELKQNAMATLISVSDTGIGIPETEFDNIFKSFYEVADVAHHHSGIADFLSGGLGVGLTIARNAVELHGGRIEVESEQGKGSTFTISFPLE